MRLSEFWSRLRAQLGEAYADSYARDQVLPQLGGRTAEQALGAGVDTVLVWRAVAEALELPASER